MTRNDRRWKGVRPSTEAGYWTVLNLLNREDFGQRHIDKVRISDAKACLIQLWNIGKRIVEQEMGDSERAE